MRAKPATFHSWYKAGAARAAENGTTATSSRPYLVGGRSRRKRRAQGAMHLLGTKRVKMFPTLKGQELEVGKEKGEKLSKPYSKLTVVPQEGLEPPHPCEYQILSLARLPVPPLGPGPSPHPPRARQGRAGERRAGWSCSAPLQGDARAWAPLPRPPQVCVRRSAHPSAALKVPVISPSRRGKSAPRSSNHRASARADRTCRDTHRCRRPA